MDKVSELARGGKTGARHLQRRAGSRRIGAHSRHSLGEGRSRARAERHGGPRGVLLQLGASEKREERLRLDGRATSRERSFRSRSRTPRGAS